MNQDNVVNKSIGFPVSVWDRVDEEVYKNRTNRSQYLLAIIMKHLDNEQDTKPPIEPDIEPPIEQDTEPDTPNNVFSDIVDTLKDI